MSSRKTELCHADKIKKLFAETGLVCDREPESLESESEIEESEPEIEEIHPEIIEEEQQHVDEEPEVVEEEKIQYDIFPTPSLRLLLPHKVRDIEQHNRIHTLPEEFKKNIDPTAIPKIATTARQIYIDDLATITGCTRYKSSLAEYWFLDTLANLLRRAQADNLSRETQVLLILWFCEWMKEIQYFDAADRARTIRRFKDNMLRISRYIAVEDRIPTPDQVGISHLANPPEHPKYQRTQKFKGKSLPTAVSLGDQAKKLKEPPKSAKGGGTLPPREDSKSGLASDFMCALQNIALIFHYIYDLFSTDYQYDLIRSIFTFTPDYTLIDAPYQIIPPKKLYQIPKPGKDKSKPKKPKLPKEKGKKKDLEPPPEDYLNLLMFIAQQDTEMEQKELEEQKEWAMKSNILPLSLAATDEMFDIYWPPPPPQVVIETPTMSTIPEKKEKKKDSI